MFVNQLIYSLKVSRILTILFWISKLGREISRLRISDLEIEGIEDLFCSLKKKDSYDFKK